MKERGFGVVVSIFYSFADVAIKVIKLKLELGGVTP